MKGNAVPSLVKMDPELLKSIVTEVKETIAIDIGETDMRARSFSIVDLWNIRRNSKEQEIDSGDNFFLFGVHE